MDRNTAIMALALACLKCAEVWTENDHSGMAIPDSITRFFDRVAKEIK